MKKTESLNEPISLFNTTPRKNFKINQLLNILNDEIRSNSKNEESKEKNYLLTTTSNTNQRNLKLDFIEKKLSDNTGNNNFIASANKSKKTKIFYAIQNFSYFLLIFSIDLQKDKRPSVNKPIIRFDNKARLKFDMNYIIGSSPIIIKQQNLVTLEKLNKEKANKKLLIDKRNEYDEYLVKASKTEDSFFDWNLNNKENLKESYRRNNK